MSKYLIVITKTARKDIATLTVKGKKKLRDIFENVIAVCPREGKKLIGDLEGYYSYRLSYRDRIVYRINEKDKCVYVLRARTHYGR